MEFVITGPDTFLGFSRLRHKHAPGLPSCHHRHCATLWLEENHLPLRLPRRWVPILSHAFLILQLSPLTLLSLSNLFSTFHHLSPMLIFSTLYFLAFSLLFFFQPVVSPTLPSYFYILQEVSRGQLSTPLFQTDLWYLYCVAYIINGRYAE